SPRSYFTHLAAAETYTLSLHDALPIWSAGRGGGKVAQLLKRGAGGGEVDFAGDPVLAVVDGRRGAALQLHHGDRHRLEDQGRQRAAGVCVPDLETAAPPPQAATEYRQLGCAIFSEADDLKLDGQLVAVHRLGRFGRYLSRSNRRQQLVLGQRAATSYRQIPQLHRAVGGADGQQTVITRERQRSRRGRSGQLERLGIIAMGIGQRYEMIATGNGHLHAV